ncbi:MAG TPA: hypothetical protein VF524_05080 [Polyangia bacterium]
MGLEGDGSLGPADSGASDIAGSSYDGSSDGTGDSGHLPTLGGFTWWPRNRGPCPSRLDWASGVVTFP